MVARVGKVRSQEYLFIDTTDEQFAELYTTMTPVYDAGSEANTESCLSIPGPPCGSAGFRDTADAEGFVHVHSGIHGIGDLAPQRYDWRNPGAYVTVRRID